MVLTECWGYGLLLYPNMEVKLNVWFEINIPDDDYDQLRILVFWFEQYKLKSQKCNDDKV